MSVSRMAEVLEEFVDASALGSEWFSRDGHRVFEAPMDNEMPCAVCGGRMRADNKSGVHAACKTSAPAAVAMPPPSASHARSLERFRTVADALGFNADQLLAEFAEDWLSRIRRAVKGGGE